MKDLQLQYMDNDAKYITKEYDNIFDFTDNANERKQIKNAGSIKFTLFENPQNVGIVDTVDDLITHLENIMK